ncbi:MAG: AAA family ATPase [Syntrophobacteraceae bacterium]
MHPPLYITRIEVNQLFGLFNYALEQTASGDQAGRIAILYGNNGSGKTTILRTIFHLLAPEDSAGHKSEIARTPFSSFQISLNDATRIRAERPTGNLLGSFNISIKQGRAKAETFMIPATEELIVSPKAQTKEQRDEMQECLTRLRSLNLGLYHLADDRTIDLAGRAALSQSETDAHFDIEEGVVVYKDGVVQRVQKSRFRRPSDLSSFLLEQSVYRFTTWIKNQVLRASSIGESSVNTLYSEILQRLALLPTEALSETVDTASLKARIRKIEAKSKSMSGYGFMPAFSGEGILRQIESATIPQRIAVMANAVTPYLESLERRLDALAGVYAVVNNFIDIVNGFLSHKHVNFDVHDGLALTTIKGDPLGVTKLSSGERHLLLIFCNTMVALDYPSIFIIDEPEISLNIKWQRGLISSLCKVIGDKPVQYIFATHSLEIIAQYRDRVLKLDSLIS